MERSAAFLALPLERQIEVERILARLAAHLSDLRRPPVRDVANGLRSGEAAVVIDFTAVAVRDEGALF